MKVCYHIQSHRSPDQLLRLVTTIRRHSPDSVVHISHDRDGSPLDRTALAALPDVAVELHQGGYGDFSHVDRYLAAVDWLDRQAVAVDWLVNLTGLDYPLRPLAEVEAELANSGADGFLETWPALGPESHWGARRARSRYFYQHRRIVPLLPRTQRLLRPLQVLNFVQPLVRLHVSYGLVVGWRVATPFGPRLRLHGGSAYSSLTWPVVAHLRDFCRSHPDVVAHFRHTLSPEEAIFQSILASSGTFTLVPDSRRYFDFTGSRFNHPRLLTVADLPQALASGAHFGRKFDLEQDPQVLDELDAHLERAAQR